jgi:lipoprotein-anchoring transpeptidase ErfK/SrfK
MSRGVPLSKSLNAAHSEVTATECKSNASGKLLLVSISQQRLWACDGTQIVYQSAVTTGASALKNVDDATPVGTWHIFGKYTNTTLRGCDANGCWKDPVAYWMPFDGSVGFHDASWQTFPFGSAEYQTGGSHGCVHLPTDTAKWVYDWAPIGTTVTVRS